MHFSSSKLQQPQQRHFSESCDLETLIKDLTLTPTFVQSFSKEGFISIVLQLHEALCSFSSAAAAQSSSTTCSNAILTLLRSFVRNFKLQQLDYVSTSMFEKMHAAPALLALLRLTTFQFHLISKSTKISLTPLKNVCEKSLHMLENHSFYVLQNLYLTSTLVYR